MTSFGQHTGNVIDINAATAEGVRQAEVAAAPATSLAHREWHRAEVQRRAATMRIDRDARKLLDDEDRPLLELPPIRGLDEMLAEPDAETPFIIEGVAPAGGRVLFAATHKSGKTTVVSNAVRARVDGERFLDAFTVNNIAESVVLIDTELSEGTLRRWLRDQGIKNTGRVHVISLRGRVGSFNLLDDRAFDAWAEVLCGCDYLILDCLRPVLDALGLDENRDAGRFLVAFDALLSDAGISDALVVQHMGHSGERARGDSRLQDWPDAIWRLVRESDEPDSPRYFTAYGRDVDIPEGRLDYDPTTRRLVYTEGSRKAAKSDAEKHEALRDIIAILVEHTLDGGQGMSQRDIKAAASDRYQIGNRRVVSALQLGESKGLIGRRDGTRGAFAYTLANPCSECAHPVIDPHRSTHHECEPKC